MNSFERDFNYKEQLVFRDAKIREYSYRKFREAN